MIDAETLVKTTAGSDEIKARGRNLPPRLRALLIMADGQLSAGQLRKAAATLGAPADALESLVQGGLLAVPQPASTAPASSAPAAFGPVAGMPMEPLAVDQGERFRKVMKFMNDSAVDSLGLRAFFFTLKLEKCFGAADLLALMPAFRKVVAKGSGDDVAGVLEARARELLRG